MSTTYSSANIDISSSSTNAFTLSLTTRKRFSFDERERIKKRRKQLNPVRLPLEHVEELQQEAENSDTECEKQDTPRYRVEYTTSLNNEEPSIAPKSDLKSLVKTELETFTFNSEKPSTSYMVKFDETMRTFKAEPPSPTRNASPKIESTTDSVPLNLTKNSRIECFPKVEPKTEPQIYSLRIDDPLKNVKSESSNYENCMSNAFIDDKKDRSSPFSPRTPPVSVMRNLFTNAVTRTTCRIFNPEAFCNICNKEFCNKYFLKTHKANKHGVYCENKDSSVDTELPAIPLMFTWNVKNNNVKVPTNPYLFNVNTVKDSSAFCNICEKEFCNKYFLRRHKEKMHGIIPFSESRKSETESEKSESDDIDRTSNTDDVKHSFHPESRNNELNLQSKYAACSANATDAVSDFIKICLTSSKHGLKDEMDSRYPNGEIDYEYMKRESNTNSIKREENVDFDVTSKMNSRYEDTQQITVGEYGVQAKEEDFHEFSTDTSIGINAKIYQSTFDEAEPISTTRYTCEFCQKTLSTNAIMRLHQKYVHVLNLEKSKEDDELEFKRMENVYFMILKFSWLNTAVTYCEICKTEFEKNDILEMHLMNKHVNLVDELSRIIEDASVNGLSAPALNMGDGNILCQICNKTFQSNAAFQQHVYEKCNFPDYKDYAEYYPGLDDIDSSKSTRNFCEICKKELCNKYFMKTHMRRMHGIAIQNGVRIGGVTCEICNKELCSKYFLRVHKKNCHGITENVQFAKLLVQDCDKFDEIQQKYMAQTCVICGRIFKSMKWLKTHLLGDHGKLGINMWQELLTGLASDNLNESSEINTDVNSSNDKEKSLTHLYQCSRCQFQTISADLLLTHQRLHAKPMDQLTYRCSYCFLVTKDKVSLEEHIAYHHFRNAEIADKNEFSN
ncbi:hypothetical protein PGB90_008706 [Kerria lacca]